MNGTGPFTTQFNSINVAFNSSSEITKPKSNCRSHPSTHFILAAGENWIIAKASQTTTKSTRMLCLIFNLFNVSSNFSCSRLIYSILGMLFFLARLLSFLRDKPRLMTVERQICSLPPLCVCTLTTHISWSMALVALFQVLSLN
jgi:hypothetical protein